MKARDGEQVIVLKDEDALTLLNMMRDAIAFRIKTSEQTFLGLSDTARTVDRYSFIKAAVMGQYTNREVEFRTDEEQDITCGFDKGL